MAIIPVDNLGQVGIVKADVTRERPSTIDKKQGSCISSCAAVHGAHADFVLRSYEPETQQDSQEARKLHEQLRGSPRSTSQFCIQKLRARDAAG